MAGRSAGGGRSRRRRLSRSAEFERVYRQGRSKANRFLVLYEFPRESDDADDGPRLGLSVSRRVGGAVDRTRVKRALREAFWQEADRLPDGADYVVVARPDAKGLAERAGTPGVRRALGELVQGLGARRQAKGAAAPDAPSADTAAADAAAPATSDLPSTDTPAVDAEDLPPSTDTPAVDAGDAPAADDSAAGADSDEAGRG
jgi:ribonuclease P protein component